MCGAWKDFLGIWKTGVKQEAYEGQVKDSLILLADWMWTTVAFRDDLNLKRNEMFRVPVVVSTEMPTVPEDVSMQLKSPDLADRLADFYFMAGVAEIGGVKAAVPRPIETLPF